MFHGWRVVAACFVIATVAWGLGTFGASVYLQSVTAAHGWRKEDEEALLESSAADVERAAQAYLATQPQPAECFVSLLLRPIVCPEVPGFTPEKARSTRKAVNFSPPTLANTV